MTADLQVLRDNLSAARDVVDMCLTAVLRANTAHAETKAEVDNLVANARAEGRIEGKNEADREAHARQLFDHEYQTLAEAAGSLAQAKAELEQARNRLDQYRDELRLHEVSVGIFAAAA